MVKTFNRFFKKIPPQLTLLFLTLFLVFLFGQVSKKDLFLKVLPAQVGPGSLNFSTSNLTLEVGQVGSLGVVLNTGGEAINGADVLIDYNASKLLVTGITPNKTNFPTFTPLNSSQTDFDWSKATASANLIEFGALTFNLNTQSPTASFAGQTSLATINLKPKPVRRDTTVLLAFVSQTNKTNDSNLVTLAGNDILGTTGTVNLNIRAEPVCRAAVGSDATVGLDDIMVIIGKGWNTACSGCPEDLDGNGVIGLGDLMQIVGFWNQVCTATS